MTSSLRQAIHRLGGAYHIGGLRRTRKWDHFCNPSEMGRTHRLGARPTLGGLRRTRKFVLLCNPPKWDAAIALGMYHIGKVTPDTLSDPLL